MTPHGKDWTLFLDRDGVLNRRLPGRYVRSWAEWVWLPGSLEAMPVLAQHYGCIIVVTNQQGIGKGLMTEAELQTVHDQMLSEVQAYGGRIDAIYHCPALATDPDNCRKPAPTMAHWAQRDFPEIDFQKSVMIGDSRSDIEFGHRLGMATVLVQTKAEDWPVWPQVGEWGLVAGIEEYAKWTADQS